jgi:hypothetical protein
MIDIQSVLENYVQNYTEIQNIRKDIKNFQKQYKNRLETLKKEQLQKEETMIKYLEDNNLPGIRKGDFVILAEEKPVIIKRKSKKEKVENILSSYQIDTNSQLAKDISNLLLKSKGTDKIKYIKCKQFSN